jgi:hypothetical protein
MKFFTARIANVGCDLFHLPFSVRNQILVMHGKKMIPILQVAVHMGCPLYRPFSEQLEIRVYFFRRTALVMGLQAS